MPLYRYQASEANGEKAASNLEAESLRTARDEFRRRRLIVLEMKELGTSTSLERLPSVMDRRLKSDDKSSRGHKIPSAQW